MPGLRSPIPALPGSCGRGRCFPGVGSWRLSGGGAALAGSMARRLSPMVTGSTFRPPARTPITGRCSAFHGAVPVRRTLPLCPSGAAGGPMGGWFVDQRSPAPACGVEVAHPPKGPCSNHRCASATTAPISPVSCRGMGVRGPRTQVCLERLRERAAVRSVGLVNRPWSREGPCRRATIGVRTMHRGNAATESARWQVPGGRPGCWNRVSRPVPAGSG